jgi:hypothetical protein
LSSRSPPVVSLRTQHAGDVSYFLAELAAPDGLRLPDAGMVAATLPAEARRRRLARLPRLVPQDETTTHVYLTTPLPSPAEKQPPVLGFAGKVAGTGTARLRLLYPVADSRAAESDRNDPLSTALPSPAWAEAVIDLDFGKATQVAPPGGSASATASRPPLTWKVSGRRPRPGTWPWRSCKRRSSASFGFAREATGRKYRVPAAPLPAGQQPAEVEALTRLYELFTGATALTESLATSRLLGAAADRGPRTVALASVKGIEVDEHPWEKMLAGKHPEVESLARFVPHDNYYVTFRGLAPLLACSAALDEWVGSLLGAYQLGSRDYRVRQRYEKQLCLDSAALGTAVKPGLVRAVVLTGSDVYLGEGSDVSVLFHVTDAGAFRAAVEPYVQAARKEHGGGLREQKDEYRGATVESFVTSLREVSLHRAVAGDVVIHSNSAVALRRLLDTQAGRRKALADGLDFRYMRGIYPHNDKAEDGFLFLPDAFIRQLVGPASKIKHNRRQEALASLALVSHAARFVAWETGKLPADQAALLAGSGLLAEEITVPDGKAATWDGQRQLAVSEVYNTRAFATPLLELSIDAVTPWEEGVYARFREEYTRLWRRYFDPVGMRLSLGERQLRLETYILPLVHSSAYHELRDRAGGGTTTFDREAIPRRTFLQLLTHIAPEHREGQGFPVVATGDHALLWGDDSPDYSRLAEMWIQQHAEARHTEAFKNTTRLLSRLPLTVGINLGDRDTPGEEPKPLTPENVAQFSEQELYFAGAGKYLYAGFNRDALVWHANNQTFPGWGRTKLTRELGAKQTVGQHGAGVSVLAFSPDGKTLASGGRDELVTLWDAGSGKKIATLRGHDRPVSALVFTPDGKGLASASWDHTIKLWDPSTGRELGTLRGHLDAIRCLAVAPDGKTLVSGGDDETVRVWDLAPRRAVRTLAGNDGWMLGVAVTADGKKILATSRGLVRIWDLAAGKELKTLRDEIPRLGAVALSPAGDTLAVGELADGKMGIWYAPGWWPAAVTAHHGDGVRALAFALDGQRLASAGVSGVVKLWEVPPSPGDGKQAGPAPAADRGDAKPAGGRVDLAGLARPAVRPDIPAPSPPPLVPVNCSAYLAPEALSEAAGALHAYLEWETHRRAVGTAVLWDLLYRTGAVAADASPVAREAVALRHLGFVPVSPDGTGYRWEKSTQEAVNVRHGALRVPRLHAGLDPRSPLRRLLAEVRMIRADLLFKEDGVQTVVTIERRAAGAPESKPAR